MADVFDEKAGYGLIAERVSEVMAMVEELKVSPQEKGAIMSKLGAIAGICQVNQRTPEEIARQEELASRFH